jgi:hypothetical protein
MQKSKANTWIPTWTQARPDLQNERNRRTGPRINEPKGELLLGDAVPQIPWGLTLSCHPRLPLQTAGDET